MLSMFLRVTCLMSTVESFRITRWHTHYHRNYENVFGEFCKLDHKLVPIEHNLLITVHLKTVIYFSTFQNAILVCIFKHLKLPKVEMIRQIQNAIMIYFIVHIHILYRCILPRKLLLKCFIFISPIAFKFNYVFWSSIYYNCFHNFLHIKLTSAISVYVLLSCGVYERALWSISTYQWTGVACARCLLQNGAYIRRNTKPFWFRLLFQIRHYQDQLLSWLIDYSNYGSK